MGRTEPLYQRAVAQDILTVVVGDMGLIEFGIFLIDDRGVWIDENIPQGGAWHPALEIDEPGSLDARSDPSLPFPFSAKELAAFALSGMGRFVSDAFFGDGPFYRESEGPWGECVEQRDAMLARLPKLANKAREAVLRAREAYDAAAAVVVPPSIDAATEGTHDTARRDRELARWRREMCQALLCPQVIGSHLNVDPGALKLLRRPVGASSQETSALSANARKGGLARHSPTNPKNRTAQAKVQVKECWEKWQQEKSRYDGKAAFARDMLDKFPDDLKSQQVIEGWARAWEKDK
jgi:hypothetical protein